MAAGTADIDKPPIEEARAVNIVDLLPIDANSITSEQWLAMSKLIRDKKPGDIPSLYERRLPPGAHIGQGQFGIVWRAKAPNGDVFAVKNLKQKSAQREIEVFERLRDYPHPCVVGVYSVHVWETSGLVSLIMELCDGGDLMKAIMRLRHEAAGAGTPYAPPRRQAAWLAQAFLGLEFLHGAAETMFRDLKPANLILDSQDRVKITDFGVSKLSIESSGAWTFGTPAGSPGYVAPELLQKIPYNTKADWYSFGVLVWVIATGGLKSQEVPGPPHSMDQLTQEHLRNGDFSILYNDVNVLRGIIQDDTGSQAHVITGDTRDLVLHLVVADPASRLDANGIREHAYFAECRLPSCREGGLPPDTKAVADWLQGF